MSNESRNLSRRAVLQTMAGAAIGQLIFGGTAVRASEGESVGGSATPESTAAATSRTIPPGARGDFEFLAGEWRISHRRLKKPTDTTWDEFKGEATCWSILGGVGSIEELRIPERDFSGMGLRLLDLEKRIWSDFWVNGKNGVLSPPGMPGGFVNGVGTFLADELDGDRPMLVRGVWDRITKRSCRWHQGISYDDGKTWQETWWMDWVRA